MCLKKEATARVDWSSPPRTLFTWIGIILQTFGATFRRLSRQRIRVQLWRISDRYLLCPNNTQISTLPFTTIRIRYVLRCFTNARKEFSRGRRTAVYRAQTSQRSSMSFWSSLSFMMVLIWATIWNFRKISIRSCAWTSCSLRTEGLFIRRRSRQS